MLKVLLATSAILALGAATAGALSHERYTLTVGNQAAGGDPGVLYVGGPANFRVRDRTGEDRPVELCITPAPIDQPGCRTIRTNRTVSGPAFSQAGETTISYAVGGERFERTVTVASPRDARAEGGPYRILAAAATYRRRDAAVVVRLDRALPARAEARSPLMLGRQILPNEVLPRGQRFYGGTTPAKVGRRDRHCYAAEAQQVIPRSDLRRGGGFKVAIRRDRRIVSAVAVVPRPGGDGLDPAFLRRVGC